MNDGNDSADVPPAGEHSTVIPRPLSIAPLGYAGGSRLQNVAPNKATQVIVGQKAPAETPVAAIAVKPSATSTVIVPTVALPTENEEIENEDDDELLYEEPDNYDDYDYDEYD